MHGVTVQRADSRFATGRVGDRKHRIRVRVVDEPERQAAMQDRLDRRSRRGRARHVRDELVHHVGVGQVLEGRKLQDVLEPHRGEPGGLDELEVPAAALDVKNRLLVAEAVALADLDGGIAAAVQDEGLVLSEQA